MITQFSPNMLKTYNSCPKKFYFRYIEHVTVPSSEQPFEKGKKIHALANYYLRNVNISRIETALTPEEQAIWQTLLQNQYFQMQCHKSEYQISCKISDYWIGGRIDAVVYDDNNFYILDYKTGSIPKNPQFDYQTMVYLITLDKLLKDYNTLSFVYIDLKHNQNHIVKFDNSLKIQYEKEIIDICKQISSETLYKPQCEDCKYCEYKNLHLCHSDNF